MMPCTILLDYGGTLDTQACHWYYLIKEAYEASGFSMDDATLRQAYIAGERALERDKTLVQPSYDFYQTQLVKMRQELIALQALGQPVCEAGDELEAVARQLASRLDQVARRCTEQSAAVLEALTKRGHALVMVSNFYGNLPTVLREYGLASYFDAVVESATVNVRKPSTEIYRLAVEAAGVAPDRCVMVGDSVKNDIRPAHAIGCRTVWYKGRGWENPSTIPSARGIELEVSPTDTATVSPEADFVITHLSQLLTLPL